MVPEFLWFYLSVLGCLLATGLALVAHETVAARRYGRMLAMAWLDLRPVRLDGTPLGWRPSLPPALIFWLAGLTGWIGLLDPLWCPWDERRQCLYDKVAGSVVINKQGAAVPSGGPVERGGAAR